MSVPVHGRRRIDVDDADWDDDSLLVHNGVRFTGEVVETAPGGQVIALTSYVNGREDGPSQEWYPDGTPKASGAARYGRAVGLHQEWQRNGQLAAQEEFDDNGKRVTSRRWDEAGNLIEERTHNR